MNAENLVSRVWNFCHILRDKPLGDLDNRPELDEDAEFARKELES